MNIKIMYKWMKYFMEYNDAYYNKSQMSYIIYRGLSTKYVYSTLDFMLSNGLVSKSFKNKREFVMNLTPKGVNLFKCLYGIYGGIENGNRCKE